MATPAPREWSLSFGRRLELVRRRRELSLEALGVIVGLTKSTISRYERDLLDPEIERVLAFAQALQVDPNILLPWNRFTLE